MSIQTQLLRGVVVLPMLLLLAVASLTSPGAHAQPQAAASARPATLVVVSDDGRVLVVSPSAR